eukprot:gb/GECH01003821.1/.p1 GENE.gb/GECH01003821.1/~~gb/GECH01003821.1/.p1  ORF type:complete len:283 (+),score=79.64 gb/GECH01003821.1/:1-849(+)
MAPKRREKPAHVCGNLLCRTASTPLWRKGWKDPLSGQHVMLCNACGIHYKKSHCCPYCYQVYRESLVDNSGDTWIGCDSCSRWVHLKCEKLATGIQVDTHQPYLCPDCKVFNNQTPDEFLQEARKRIATKAMENGRHVPAAAMSVERSPLKQNKTKKIKEQRKPRKIVVRPREEYAADSGSDSSLYSPISVNSGDIPSSDEYSDHSYLEDEEEDMNMINHHHYYYNNNNIQMNHNESIKNLDIDVEAARKMLARSFPRKKQDMLKFGSLWAVCEMARQKNSI